MERYAAVIVTAFLAVLVLSYGHRTHIPVIVQESEEAKTRNMTEKLKGTFIQWWLVKDWNDIKWRREFKAISQLGMKYVVLTPTAFLEKGKDGSYSTYTVYPTEIDGFEAKKDEKAVPYADTVEMCLKNAQQFDIKVFLGLNFGDDWWKNRGREDWMKQRAREGNLIASELYEKYHGKYPDAFYGWYWGWEVDNFHFRTVLDLGDSKRVLARTLKLQLDYMQQNGFRMPFMISPYMNSMLGTPSDYARLWKYVFEYSGFDDRDVFCLQDSVGAEGINEKDMTYWFSKIAEAVETIPGMRFWANIETFDINDWTAVTLDTLTRRMKLLDGTVDGHMTFSYTHYYSPNVTASGFHDSLAEFVSKGRLENRPPSTPQNFVIDYDSGDVILKWEPSHDNKGVLGYLVYRDGKLISVLKEGTRGSASSGKKLTTEYRDQDVTGGEHAYEIKSFDFSGNVSESAWNFFSTYPSK